MVEPTPSGRFWGSEGLPGMSCQCLPRCQTEGEVVEIPKIKFIFSLFIFTLRLGRVCLAPRTGTSWARFPFAPARTPTPTPGVSGRPALATGPAHLERLCPLSRPGDSRSDSHPATSWGTQRRRATYSPFREGRWAQLLGLWERSCRDSRRVPGRAARVSQGRRGQETRSRPAPPPDDSAPPRRRRAQVDPTPGASQLAGLRGREWSYGALYCWAWGWREM